MRRKVWLWALAFLGITAIGAQAAEFVQGQVLVKLKKGAAASALSGVRDPASKDRNLGHVLLVHLKSGVTVEGAIATLSASSNVEYAAPNFIRHTMITPNDPSYGNQWGYAKISAPTAWNTTTGAPSVVISDIDTGADLDHPDLAGNIWTNALEASGTPGVDDDGNGYVDDVHGWNAITNTPNPQDDNKHGTHTAGTIAAVGNNGTGVTGVNWNSKVLPCKFLDAGGSGTDADAIECINYTIATKNNAASGANVRVSSNSWGGGGFSQPLKDAIDAAGAAGILWVNAAGNSAENNDCFPDASYPSSYSSPNIIAVAASTESDGMASFSQYGSSTVDIGAPGTSIYSTLWNNGYGYLDGTSMATPHVAGVAGLVLAVDPGLTLAQLKERILINGDPIASMDGDTTTGMRLNAAKAVAGTVTVPPDRDGDGTPDYRDNCPYVANASQADANGDGVGDDCAPTCGGGGCGGAAPASE